MARPLRTASACPGLRGALHVFVLLGAGFWSTALAQPFTVQKTTLGGEIHTPGAWGDHDGDGDLDFILPNAIDVLPDPHVGHWLPLLFRNDGPGGYVEVLPTFTGRDVPFNWPRADWYDYDGDADLDLLLGAAFYENEGGETFAFLQELSEGVTWADYDDDGDQDALGARFVFEQTAPGTLRGTAPPWSTDGEGEGLSAVDFDGDGDVDVAIAGRDAQWRNRVRFFRNDGRGKYTDLQTLSVGDLRGWIHPLHFADFDRDGDVDFVLPFVQNGVVTRYRHEAGRFEAETMAAPASMTYLTHTGDLEGDGDVDLFSLTQAAGGVLLNVLVNGGDGTFAHAQHQVAADVALDRLVVDDVDRDGDLDLLFAPPFSSGRQSLVLVRNDAAAGNTPPGGPSGAHAVTGPGRVTLQWEGAADDTTPAHSLTYNLRIGTAPGRADVLPPQARTETGQRLLHRPGNAGQGLSRTLHLAPGRYYWAVQAVDPAHAASAFTVEQSFDVPAPEAPLFVPFAAPLDSLAEGDLAWGDFDHDGDLDLVAGGLFASSWGTRRYRNDGAAFSPLEVEYAGYSPGQSVFTWIDHDLDGHLDLSMQGAWGDYDRDGDPDQLLHEGYLEHLPILRNDGNGAFTENASGIGRIEYGGVLFWVDLDGDGDLDVFVSGVPDQSGGLTALRYRNDGGRLTAMGGALPGLTYGAVDWADYDLDGDPDLIFSGRTSDYDEAFVMALYRNDGATLTAVDAGLPAVTAASVAWGDYDGDGDPDLLASALDEGGRPVTLLYRNDEGRLVEQEHGLPAVVGRARWGDFDGDGKLDVGLVGMDRFGASVLALYRNTTKVSTAAPGPPQSLGAQVEGATATLTWTPAAGARTFDVRVGTRPGAADVVAAAARADGRRLVPGPGAAGRSTSFVLNDLPAGTYYWSVQAVDAAFRGSAFAPEQSFTVSGSNVRRFSRVETPFPDGTGGLHYGETGVLTAGWADYDGDGDLDVLVGGSRDNAEAFTALFRNDSGGGATVFTAVDAGLPASFVYSVTWPDVDGDDDPDLLVMSREGSPFGRPVVPVLYRNDGGTFVPVEHRLPVPQTTAPAAWADYDGDGDSDLLAGGVLFSNHGGDFFQVWSMPSSTTDATWADYDGDGDPDLLGFGTLYRNDGGRFVASGQSFSQQPVSVWSDFDGDADLDLVQGSDYHRNEGGTFQPAVALVPEFYVSAGAAADYDNDGDVDLLLAGSSGSSGHDKMYLLRNDGTGRFAETPVGIPGARSSSVTWADHDDDGTLDVLVHGAQGAIRLYRNVGGPPDTPPPPPSGLAAVVDRGSAVLTWQGAANSPAADRLVTYNLRVGTAPGRGDVRSALASVATGRRRVPGPGNAGLRPTATLHDLPNGTYYWTVQAVDQGFAGSTFAAEGTFEIFHTDLRTLTAGPSGLDPFAVRGLFGWHDYDRDGRLDVLVSVIRPDWWAGMALLRRTDGGFEPVPMDSVFDRSSFRGGSWGDVDRNGWPDLLATAAVNTGDVTRLYLNDAGRLSPAMVAFDSLFNAGAALIDFDRDGALDVFLTGTSLLRPHEERAFLYRNTPAGFERRPFPEASRYGKKPVVLDVDADGDADLLLLGRTATSWSSLVKVLRNDGGTFTAMPDSLADVESFAAGDLDDDGDPDLVALRAVSGGRELTWLRNDGRGGFMPIGLGAVPDALAPPVLLDFDNDGRLDVFVGGASSVLYLNAGDGRFEAARWPLPSVTHDGATTGADYDGDGHADLFVLAREEGAYLTSAWKGGGLDVNTPPEPPAGLAADVDGTTVTLRWLPALDGQTLPEGLTYHLAVGTTPGAADVVATASEGALVGPGPIWGAARSVLDLPDGTYYARVLAVDNGFARSPYSAEVRFGVPGSPSGTEPPAATPARFAVRGSYPNPARARATVLLDLPEAAGVAIRVYDLAGREVFLGRPASLPAGRDAALSVDVAGLASGVYLYRVTATTASGAVWSAQGRLAVVR